MIIFIRVAALGPHGQITTEGQIQCREGSTLKDLFNRVDKELGLKPRLFREALRGRSTATILLNGNRVEVSESMSQRLGAGDEITLLDGLAGG